jgi:drug/metabolite transporter (DMT)-like permease
VHWPSLQEIARLWIAWGLTFAAASFYGLIPPFVRAAYENGVPAVETTLFRTTFIVFALGGLAFVRGERLVIPRAARASFLLQVLATAMISIGYLASVQFIPVGLAVIILYTGPLTILVVAPVVEGTTPGPARFAIALAGFGGLVVALGFSLEGLDWRGVALAVAGAAGYALQFFSGRLLTRHLSPSVMAGLVHAAVWPIVLGTVLWQNGGAIRLLDRSAIAVAGYVFLACVTLCYILAYMIQMLALRYAPASVIAPVFNVEPIVTTGAAALVVGERLSIHQYVGGGVVFGALVGAALVAQREEARASARSGVSFILGGFTLRRKP